MADRLAAPDGHIPSGRVEITGSKLAGNSASSGGAAVNNVSNGTVTITDSEVVDNPGEMIPDPAQFIDPLDPEPVEYIPGPGVYEPAVSAIGGEGEFEGLGTIRVVDSLVARNYAPTQAPASTSRRTAPSRSSTPCSRTTPPRPTAAPFTRTAAG